MRPSRRWMTLVSTLLVCAAATSLGACGPSGSGSGPASGSNVDGGMTDDDGTSGGSAHPRQGTYKVVEARKHDAFIANDPKTWCDNSEFVEEDPFNPFYFVDVNTTNVGTFFHLKPCDEKAKCKDKRFSLHDFEKRTEDTAGSAEPLAEADGLEYSGSGSAGDMCHYSGTRFWLEWTDKGFNLVEQQFAIYDNQNCETITKGETTPECVWRKVIETKKLD